MSVLLPSRDDPMNATPSTAKRRRPYMPSGVYTLKRTVQTLGKRALPSTRTALGRELQAWRKARASVAAGERPRSGPSRGA